jgi:aryl-alcohol dehydrogenase-like predicted oxidoreductase
MEMMKLGSQGPDISVIGYGAWEAGGDWWGRNESDQIVIEAMHAAIDIGMTWIDTAEVYGRGYSEELVGKAVAGRRDEVLIFTKVAPKPAGTGFRADEVKQAIQGSLKRLGVDYVDLYQLHWPDTSVPVDETWTAMAEVVDQGLARHIGVSNHPRMDIERCLAIRHVDSIQNQFSLLHQDDRRRPLPWAAEQGIGYLAYSPLGAGILTGAITKETKFADDDLRSGKSWGSGLYHEHFTPRQFEKNVEKVERLRPIAEGLGISVATLALRWVVEQKGVTGAIAGSRNPDHVRTNASAGDLRLDPVVLEEIDAIFS